MKLIELLSQLKASGIRIKNLDGELHIQSRDRKPISSTLAKEIEAKKDEIIAFLSKYSKMKEDKYAPIKPATPMDYYSLSAAQKRVYIIQQMLDESTVYNMPAVFELSGTLDKNKLEDTFRQLIIRHESLRTSFLIHEKRPMQMIHPQVNFQVEYHRAEPNDSQGEVEIVGEFIRPFDLSLAPLFRVGLICPRENSSHRHILMVDMHHVISDGSSLNIIVREFMALYGGEKLPPLRLQYKDYSEWQNSELQLEDMKKQEAFWQDQFTGDLPVLNLINDFPRPPVQSSKGDHVSFQIELKEASALKGLALHEGASFFIILLTVYNILLSKLSAQDDIIIGTPIAGRQHADLEPIVGMFVNTLALRNYPTPELTFRQFLKDVNKRTLKCFANQSYPYEGLVEILGVTRDPGRNPLFDTLFTLQNIDFPPLDIKGLAIRPFAHNRNPAKFDIMLTGAEYPEGIFLTFAYCSDLFKKETVTMFTRCFKSLISRVIDDWEIPISRIEIIPPQEKAGVLEYLNSENAPFPRGKTINQLFLEQVEKRPWGIAVVGPMDSEDLGLTGEIPGDVMLSYGQLHKQVQKTAIALRSLGMGMEMVVPLIMERTVEMIPIILGILEAGATYLPIDPSYPAERLQYILQDSGATLLVHSLGIHCQPGAGVEIIEAGELLRGKIKTKEITNEPNVSVPSMAYIIYTSGTTGKPKGCMVSHDNVISLLDHRPGTFDFTHEDIWTMFHRNNFDFSVWEMYGALLNGGKLIVVSQEATRDPELYLDILAREKVTVLNQTPSAFYNLAALETLRPKARLSLRWVIFGGESLNPVRLKEWHGKYPKTRIFNMYGITETTIFVTYKEIGEIEIEQGISNIGIALPTMKTSVMDRHHLFQPSGVPGELCVYGEGVCRGYLNRPELTAEKFVNGRYHSGDLVRVMENREMEYLGRIDHQVKIRGFRIELGEIEQQLSRHPGVSETHVLAWQNPEGQNELCAYVVVNEAGNFDKNVLREFLALSLPEYMIPGYFIELTNLPLTANGKLDRKALPDPGNAALYGKKDYVKPGTGTEKMIAQVWSEILNLEQVGIEDNFFEIGGNSLNIIQVSHLINDSLGEKIPVMVMFRFPTIRGLSQYLDCREEATPLDRELRAGAIKRGKEDKQYRLEKRKQRRRV